MLKIIAATLFLCSAFASEPLDSAADFTHSFYEKIEKEDFVASPFSIFTCLSMAYAGADNGTEDAMAKALCINVDKEVLAKAFSSYLIPRDSAGYDLRIANSLWVKEGLPIEPSFRQTVENDYRAAVQNIDFFDQNAAAARINGWISDKTENRITDLLSSSDLSDDTALVLANAIYFKGAFRNPFDIDMTHEDLFAEAPALMMEQIASIPYFETPDAQIAALPFVSKGPETPPIALVVVLPRKGSALTLPASADFRSWLGALQYERVHVKMPKFSLKTPLDLNPILAQMGMERAMDPERANFSGIDGRNDLYISKALHQAFFALNEAGVEAAAATAVVMNMTTAFNPNPPRPIEFIADRPFLFFIVDMKSQIPLFIGRLTNAPES